MPRYRIHVDDEIVELEAESVQTSSGRSDFLNHNGITFASFANCSYFPADSVILKPIGVRSEDEASSADQAR